MSKQEESDRAKPGAGHDPAPLHDPDTYQPPQRVNFNCSVNGYEQPDGSFALQMSIKLDESSTLHQSLLFTVPEPGLLGIYSVPPGVFPSEAKRQEWVRKTRAFFWRRLFDTLTREASAHMADAGNYYLDELGLDPAPVSRKELVEIHLNETRARVSAYLGAKGQRTKWTRAELDRAVRGALGALSPSQPHTLNAVARVLQRTHPKKAPASGEALGVQLKRFKIDWKELRREAKTDS